MEKKDTRTVIVSKNYTILETIQSFQVNHDRVALVEDNNKIIGLVSQGDILKELLRGVQMHSLVENIMNRNFRYMNNYDMEKAYQLFKKHKLTMIPVLSESNELQDIITLDDVYTYLENKK